MRHQQCLTSHMCLSLTLKDVSIQRTSFEVLGGVHLDVLHRRGKRLGVVQENVAQGASRRPPILYAYPGQALCSRTLCRYMSGYGLDYGGTMRGASAYPVGSSTCSMCGRMPILRSTHKRRTHKRRASRCLADRPCLVTRAKESG